MFKNRFMPLLMADGAGGSGAGSGGNGDGQNNSGNNNNEGGKTPEIDYEKLGTMLAGRLGATEDSVLKGYFKQQGLSADEVQKAINDYKAQKKANEPNIDDLNKQIKTANDLALQSQINLEAYKLAGTLGADSKNIDYVMKLADMSDVVVDGKISTENLQKALEKVLTDVPAFKASSAEGGKGFSGKVGSEGGGKSDDPDAMLRKAMGLK